MHVEGEEDGASPDEPEAASAYLCKYFGIHAVDATKSVFKHATCNSCKRNFSACSTTRASAHILILGQKTARINPCIPINKKDDNRLADFRAAQKDVAEKIQCNRNEWQETETSR